MARDGTAMEGLAARRMDARCSAAECDSEARSVGAVAEETIWDSVCDCRALERLSAGERDVQAPVGDQETDLSPRSGTSGTGALRESGLTASDAGLRHSGATMGTD